MRPRQIEVGGDLVASGQRVRADGMSSIPGTCFPIGISPCVSECMALILEEHAIRHDRPCKRYNNEGSSIFDNNTTTFNHSIRSTRDCEGDSGI